MVEHHALRALRMNGQFEAWSHSDLAELIEAHPLAWVVSRSDRFRATPLPLLLERDTHGAPVALLGHFARSNPQVRAVAADPSALFLFMGPHGYISPTMAGRSDWGPTWNYAVVRIEGDIQLDPALNEEAVERLISRMEGLRAGAWRAEQLGDRYDQLIRHIVAFRASISRIDTRFKLGQDESDDVFAAIVDSLDGNDLANWMQRMARRNGAELSGGKP